VLKDMAINGKIESEIIKGRSNMENREYSYLQHMLKISRKIFILKIKMYSWKILKIRH